MEGVDGNSPIERTQHVQSTLFTTAVPCGRNLYRERCFRAVMTDHCETLEAVALRAAVLVLGTEFLELDERLVVVFLLW